VEIDGNGVIEFGGQVSNDITLGDDASGLVIFDHSTNCDGVIAGLNFDDRIDLRDLGFNAGTTMSYTDNGLGGGILTVSDGQRSVELHLVGNYSANDFLLASDGYGGVLLTNGVGTGLLG
jgi:hypothetical protein